ncbi:MULTISPECIES: division/cell wall cluster transcriptional repressor MraZ [Rhodovulum]|uniref:Transcriptional regulator MraZ n=2 Tax=Rhodovulum TaxID=34008 RepID=A0A844BDB9_9RHOB|nr:division/cell wall cluster transcriptional repressor MraZ [Rhodovulum steppense]MRH20598.1 division/cell wall cluster transcriptional repressor MraZ [Rhodovulum strictum]TCM77831.1 MraZ protein [Rhodovulum steppense]
MARRFRGESRHKVDAKGRVSIPSTFRRVLEAGDPDCTDGQRPQLVIVYGDHRRKYLECYTMEAMEEIDRKIAAKPRGSIERQILELTYNGQSHTTEVDNDGRLVLPQKLREKIELGDEAYFIGHGDTFRIWNPDTFETEEMARARARLDDLPPDFDVASLLDGSLEG